MCSIESFCDRGAICSSDEKSIEPGQRWLVQSGRSLLTMEHVLDRLAKYPANVIQVPVYAFWDTEATGLMAQDDHIISLGCVLCLYSDEHGFEPFAEFHEYVQTSRRMDPVAAAVHHITPAMLSSKGHPFPDVIQSWCDWFQGATQGMNRRIRTLMLAHNGHGFDDLILYCNMKIRMEQGSMNGPPGSALSYETVMKKLRVEVSVDTMKMLRFLYKDVSEDQCPKNSNKKIEFGLGTCFTFFCERPELEGAHDALVDTWALVDVMNSPRVRKVVKAHHFSATFCKSNITYYRPFTRMLSELDRSAGLKVKMTSVGAIKVTTKLPDRPLLNMPEFGYDDPDMVQLCWTCMCYGKLTQHQCALT